MIFAFFYGHEKEKVPNRKARQVDGKWTQGTDFIPVSVSGKDAKNLRKYRRDLL